MGFYSRYIELCLKMGVSASRMAENAGINSGTVSNWKKKHNRGEDVTPDKETIEKLCALTNCDEAWLRGINIKKTAPGVGDGLEEEIREIIQLLNEASPELRAAALAVLKSAGGSK